MSRELINKIIDTSVDIQDSLLALISLKNDYPDDYPDVIDRIVSMYSFDPMTKIERMMMDISVDDFLDIGKLYSYCSQLVSTSDDVEFITNFLLNVSLRISEFDWLLMTEFIIILAGFEGCVNRIIEICIDIFINSEIKPFLDKINFLNKLTKLEDKRITKQHNKILDTLYEVNIFNPNLKHNEMIRYSSNYLVVKTRNNILMEKILDQLVLIARNNDIEFDTRGDACDVIRRSGVDKYYEIGGDILKELGMNGVCGDINFYKNKQNIHNNNIEKDVYKNLNMIYDISPIINNENIDMFMIRKFLKNFVSKDVYTHINRSLTFIDIDISEYDLGIERILIPRDILFKLFSLIMNEPDEEVKKLLSERLVDELKDMKNTCTTGHVHRLANVPSGIIKGYEVSIGIADEINGSITNRLYKLLEDEDEALEGIYDNKKIIDNSALLKVFRENIGQIYTDLKDEYNKIDDFDDHFRLAYQQTQDKFNISENNDIIEHVTKKRSKVRKLIFKK